MKKLKLAITARAKIEVSTCQVAPQHCFSMMGSGMRCELNENEQIRVEAEGPQGGQYAFWVDTDGNSEVVYIDPDDGGQEQGPVKLARLVWPGDRRIST